MVITFLISGLWHGAAWTFVLWGLYQGIFLVIDANSARSRKRYEKKHNLKNNAWWKLAMTILTYAVITLGLIFFRANSVADSFMAFKEIFSNWGTLFVDKRVFFYGGIAIVILLIKDYIDEYHTDIAFLSHKKMPISIIAFTLLLCWVIATGVFDGGQFIYFQF